MRPAGTPDIPEYGTEDADVAVATVQEVAWAELETRPLGLLVIFAQD